ncbi:MAG: YciI family protein [Pseudolysinimonas sp.]|uniref:YciI family protein n=1 Tax=Pseudolysinimonas sp. TaxID=2680009 RepID=UPI003C728CDE
MILIHSNETAERAWADGESDDLGAAHGALFAELAASGELVDGNELATDDVAVIGRHNGEPIATRGPSTEGTEWIGGYYIVDVADRERAVEIAGRLAETTYSPIEIRRIMHAPPTD